VRKKQIFPEKQNFSAPSHKKVRNIDDFRTFLLKKQFF